MPWASQSHSDGLEYKKKKKYFMAETLTRRRHTQLKENNLEQQ